MCACLYSRSTTAFAAMTAGSLRRGCLWHFIPLSDYKCSFVAFLSVSVCLSMSTTAREGALKQSHSRANQEQLHKLHTSQNKL